MTMQDVPTSTPPIIRVEASAGSGKTYALAIHYLQILFKQPATNPVCLSEILAITFTNKAAIEMKERIMSFLWRLAHSHNLPADYSQDLLTALELTADEARERARNALYCIVRHYDYFQVQTIDSFVHGILSGVISSIPRRPGFRIVRSLREYMAYFNFFFF
jgi:ATP-dependent exoDNAse (exonuclease V) beta subunit